MKKHLFALIAILAFSFPLTAQQLDKENTYDFKSLKKDSYLGNVDYDPETKTTTLSYVENNSFNTIFTNYLFDENLNFVEEITDKYTFGDALEDLGEAISKYKWFNYKGDVIEKDIVGVFETFGGKLQVYKYKWTRTYNWNFGFYNHKFEKLDEMKIEGLDDDRIALYDKYINSETGDVVLLLGLKPSKAERKTAKWQQLRKFQIMKINSDFQVEYGDKIEFDHNMAVGFRASMNNEDTGSDDGDLNEYSADLAVADVVLVFSPIKSMMAKQWQSDNPEKQTMVFLNADGKLTNRIDYSAPTSGWVIDGLVTANDGNDIYFYGPAKDGAYVNMLTSTITPMGATADATEDIKFKDYQIMKISNGELAWINSTDLKEFEAKSVTPPSQRQSPDYKGKDFEIANVSVTEGGELFIAGQKYKTKTTAGKKLGGFSLGDDDSNDEKVVYKDLVMFQFDANGKLKSQFGIKRDENNKHAKNQLTPQYLYPNEDGTQLYWVYGEIQGLRKGFTLAEGLVTVSKRKLLFYPAVAKIDLASGNMGDFVPFGTDAGGKQEYYTNPEFPQLLTSDYSNLIFVGENKKGTLLWLGRMGLK